MNNSWNTLSDSVNQFTRASGAAQRVLGLMDNLPVIKPNTGKQLIHPKGRIQLEKVEFFYQMRPDQKILKGIDLFIEAGTVCAFVGRSGGGKFIF